MTTSLSNGEVRAYAARRGLNLATDVQTTVLFLHWLAKVGNSENCKANERIAIKI